MVRAMIFSPFLIRVFTPATVSPQETGEFPLYEAMMELFRFWYRVLLSGEAPVEDAPEHGCVSRRAMMNVAAGNEYRDFIAGYYTRMKLN
jgi:hypothetical protein